MTARSERLLRVCVDDKYGFINLRGELIVPCQFELASEFYEGLATVRTHFDNKTFEDHEVMVVNDRFEQVGRLRCSYWGHFSEGLMSFERSDRRGYVDTALQVVIPPSFRNAHEFVDGLAWASVNIELHSGVGGVVEREGFINRKGEWVIPAQYARTWNFAKGERVTAFTRDLKNWGLIDKQGRELVNPTFAFLHGTSKGLTPAAIRTGKGDGHKFGFINEVGEWTVTPRFDHCDAMFVNDTLGAAVGDRWGVVTRDGGWIIEPRFTYAEAFHEGLSRVYVGGSHDGMGYSGGKCGYIDRNGEYVIEPCFDDAWPFENGVAKVEFIQSDWQEGGNRKLGYIDTQGRYIWKPTR